MTLGRRCGAGPTTRKRNPRSANDAKSKVSAASVKVLSRRYRRAMARAPPESGTSSCRPAKVLLPDGSGQCSVFAAPSEPLRGFHVDVSFIPPSVAGPVRVVRRAVQGLSQPARERAGRSRVSRRRHRLVNGKPAVHIHAVVVPRDGIARGGHVLHATVWPTLEVFPTAYPTPLTKELDPATDLDLFEPEA
jgi:hypothetical protein